MSMDLQFQYKKEDEKLDEKSYFESNAHLPFDSDSKIQMQIMINAICNEIQHLDDYAIKRLEVCLKYELPFFASNRRLVKNWILENFIF